MASTIKTATFHFVIDGRLIYQSEVGILNNERFTNSYVQCFIFIFLSIQIILFFSICIWQTKKEMYLCKFKKPDINCLH